MLPSIVNLVGVSTVHVDISSLLACFRLVSRTTCGRDVARAQALLDTAMAALVLSRCRVGPTVIMRVVSWIARKGLPHGLL